jgi:hypothetical protein
MIELEEIRNRARQDLVIVTDLGFEDVYLWERSVRITASAARIAQLPDLAAYSLDPVALEITGLYHDAGWISQYQDGVVTREQIGCKLTTPVQRELGAALMERSLQDVLPADTLQYASDAIRSLNDHNVAIFEAQLVAEAENLDAFGALALWHLARKHAHEGRGLEAAIETWEAQKQYGYWTARINDSLRFEAVKRIAQERLAVFDRAIKRLTAHHRGEDISTAVLESSRTQ